MHIVDMTSNKLGLSSPRRYHVVMRSSRGDIAPEIEQVCVVRDAPISLPSDVLAIEKACRQAGVSGSLLSWQRYELGE